jgi:hypothetical protein
MHSTAASAARVAPSRCVVEVRIVWVCIVEVSHGS